MENSLCNITDDNRKDIFEQYKLYVEMADKISQQRLLSNSFYTTLNTILLTVLGVKWDSMDNLLFLVAGIGIILSLIWFFNVRSYRQLNSGKFKIIQQMEEYLPFRAYKAEWDILEHGKKKSVYWPVSHIEKWIPWLFFALYLIIITINILKYV